MNPALLIAHFDRVSDVPDAVPRLRRFVIDLAVRGKLADQDPNDGTGSDLLSSIRKLKIQLIKEKHVRGEQSVERSFPDTDVGVPATWVWAYVDDVAIVQGGKRLPNGATFSDEPTSHIYIRVTNMKDGTINKNGLRYITPEVHLAIAKYTICREDLYITIAGTIGQVGRVPDFFDGQNLTENAAKIVFRGLDPDYFRIALSSDLVQEQFRDKTKQMAQPKLALKRILGAKFPLPPLAEQRRIVTKVDELMALCDRLEESRHKQEEHREGVASSALHHLSNGASSDSLRQSSLFYLDHLADLTVRPSQITGLRQTILSLAVRGRLAPQNQSDESASALVNRIQAEKLRHIEAGSLRKEKPLPAIVQQEAPFTIAENWIWARIGTCALLTEYGTSVKSDEHEDGIPVLAMGDIQGGQVVLKTRKKVPRQIEDLPQLFLKRLDLLYNRTNSPELVGKTGIFLGEDDAFTFASYLIRIRFISGLISPAYVNIAMNAPYFRETQIVPELRQQCGQANVNGTKLKNMMIPLPPITEQQRIVTKVEQLMSLCDQLESQITGAQERARNLLESVLYHALSDGMPVAQPRSSVLYEAKHTGTA